MIEHTANVIRYHILKNSSTPEEKVNALNLLELIMDKNVSIEAGAAMVMENKVPKIFVAVEKSPL